MGLKTSEVQALANAAEAAAVAQASALGVPLFSVLPGLPAASGGRVLKVERITNDFLMTLGTEELIRYTVVNDPCLVISQMTVLAVTQQSPGDGRATYLTRCDSHISGVISNNSYATSSGSWPSWAADFMFALFPSKSGSDIFWQPSSAAPLPLNVYVEMLVMELAFAP